MQIGGYIPHAQLPHLTRLVQPGKVVVIYGPRRVGKTTLLEHYLSAVDEDYLLVPGDDISVRDFLESQSVAKLKSFVGAHTLLALDEAQYVRHIGANLKLLVDHMPSLKIIATGSSSFELAAHTGEPLTGRKYTLLLLPLAQQEIGQVEAAHETHAMLEQRLVFGSYPEVVLMADIREKERYLKELVSSYLFKDILQLEDVRNAEKLNRLLQLIAFQVGKDVSLAELGSQLGMSKNTVERYLDLLEKVFVIHSRRGFSRNLRKEISKSRRYFFVDNGIRNALINNFNSLALRDDVGALWENYLITERMKYHLNRGDSVASYFWRTYDRQEIDLVEETGGRLFAYEAKWRRPGRASAPAAWQRAYPGATYEVVSPENYLAFITATSAP